VGDSATTVRFPDSLRCSVTTKVGGVGWSGGSLGRAAAAGAVLSGEAVEKEGGRTDQALRAGVHACDVEKLLRAELDRRLVGEHDHPTVADCGTRAVRREVADR
jgi:hypothetical protein